MCREKAPRQWGKGKIKKGKGQRGEVRGMEGLGENLLQWLKGDRRS